MYPDPNFKVFLILDKTLKTIKFIFYIKKKFKYAINFIFIN